MKKNILILFALVMFSTGSFAQISYGVKGSLNLFNMTGKYYNDAKVNGKMIPTFGLGVYGDLSLSDEFFVRPELLFSKKGGDLEKTDNYGIFHTSYLELPISFLYKGALSNGKVLVGVGPYFALGIGGNLKHTNSTDAKIKYKNEVKETDDIDKYEYLKPLDFGGKVYFGYEMKSGLSFALESSLGLSNTFPPYEGVDWGNIKNVGFGLALGYKIK